MENQHHEHSFQQNPYGPPHAKEMLKNSTATLVLGILSLVFVGGIGIILAIIALAISANSVSLANAYPGRFRGEKNLKAGRVCSIICLCLAGFLLLILIIAGIAAS